MNFLKENSRNKPLNYQLIILLLLLVGIFFLSAYIQFTTSMNIDAANALHEAKLLFSGGKYFYDFYETTPPMFLYLDFPVVEILKYVPNANFFVVFFLYYVALSIVTIIFSACILNKIYDDSESLQKILAILVIAFVMLVEPPYYFGQREHTSVILTIPYFLLFSLRLESKNENNFLTVLISIFAGIGFAIKPQFCLAFFLTEIVFLIKRKSFSDFLRIDNGIVYGIFIVYAISTYLLYPAYFHVIIPLTMQFYYVGISEPFINLFFHKFILFAFFTILFFLLERKYISKKSIYDALCVAILGYGLSYISQMVAWDYHAFPVLAFAMILNVFLLISLLTNKSDSKSRRVSYLFFVFLIYLFDTSQIPNIWHTHVLLLSCLVGFELAWFFRIYFFKKTCQGLSVFFLTILLFFFPLMSNYFAYRLGVYVKAINQPLVQYLKKYAYKKPVYFFESVLNYEYPPVDYAGAVHVSRFCYLLWLPAYLKALFDDPNSAETAKLKNINDYFMKLMSADIAQKKPEFIFVDASDYVATPVFQIRKFNYLALFLKTPEFQSVWKNYHYFGSIGVAPNYKLNVYQLNQKA